MHGNGSEVVERLAKINRTDVKKAMDIFSHHKRKKQPPGDMVVFKTRAFPAKETLRIAYVVALRRRREFVPECRKFKEFANASKLARFKCDDIGEFSWGNLYYRWMLHGCGKDQFKNSRGPLTDKSFEVLSKEEFAERKL